MGNFFSKAPPAAAGETQAKESPTVAEAKKDTKECKGSEETVPPQECKDSRETVPPPECEDKQEESVVKDINTSLLTEATTSPLPQSPESPASTEIEETEPLEILPPKLADTKHDASTEDEELNPIVKEPLKAEPDHLNGPLAEQGTIECDQTQDGAFLKDSTVQMVAKVEQLAEELSNVVISTAAQEINTTAAAAEDVLSKLPDVPDDEIVVDAKDNDSQDIDILPEPETKVDMNDEGLESHLAESSTKASDKGISDEHGESEKHDHDAMASDVSIPGHHE
jgi:hypothetical protein